MSRVFERRRVWTLDRSTCEAGCALLATAIAPRFTAFDRRGLPWGLDERLAITPRLTRLTRLLFPTLMSGGDRRAA